LSRVSDAASAAFQPWSSHAGTLPRGGTPETRRIPSRDQLTFEAADDADPAPLAKGRGRAKVRTGGSTRKPFPPQPTARFLYRCAKARGALQGDRRTASSGPSVQRCTYQATAHRADARIHQRLPGRRAALHRGSAGDAIATLEEDRPMSSISTTRLRMAYAPPDRSATPRGARAVRHKLRLCSFEEPIADLKRLGCYDDEPALRRLPTGRGERDRCSDGRSDSPDLRRGTSAGLFDSLLPDTRAACTSDTLNALMALTPLTGTHFRERLIELSGVPTPSLISCPCRMPRWSARRYRRLHRFLRLDRSRPMSASCSAGQSAAAQLQTHPDRVSRAGVSDRGSGTPIRRPNGQTQVSTSVPLALSTTNSNRVLHRDGQRLGEPIPIESARIISRRSAWSTTGRARHYRPGIPASRPFWARASRPRSRRGSCRWKRSFRIVFRFMRVRRTTLRRCRISIRRRIGAEAPSTHARGGDHQRQGCARTASRHSA